MSRKKITTILNCVILGSTDRLEFIGSYVSFSRWDIFTKRQRGYVHLSRYGGIN